MFTNFLSVAFIADVCKFSQCCIYFNNENSNDYFLYWVPLTSLLHRSKLKILLIKVVLIKYHVSLTHPKWATVGLILFYFYIGDWSLEKTKFGL